MHSVYVLVTHNGSVLWPVPVKLMSSCRVDITYFPFDDQTCELNFGSWVYSPDWVDYHGALDSLDLGNYIDNSEWKLVAVNFQVSSSRRNLCFYYCFPAAAVFNYLVWDVWVMALGSVYHNRFPDHITNTTVILS